MGKYEGKRVAPSGHRKGRFEGGKTTRPVADEMQNRAPAEKAKPRKRRNAKRDLLVIGIPMLCALVAVAVVLFVANRGSTYRIQDSGAQYYAGTSAAINANAEMKVSEEGVVQFADSNSETTLPIYLNNSRSVVLTTDMIYYMPRSGSYSRAAALSQIDCQANGMITVSRNQDSVTAEAGFLYDGGDFYLFLEPVVINYMGYEVQLPSLSYAEVIYGETIMLFNYETKECTMETLEGTATAQAVNGDYSISLLGDSMTDKDEELTLLVTKSKDIEPLV